MGFKDFYKEVSITTTSIGGSNAQFADKIGKKHKRICKYCKKEIKDGEDSVIERRMDGDSWHKSCVK